ncbi:MAG TPA: hypothetical protein GXX16_09160 [Epulopiscium sp.]|nr:hypothetical protein [Candidatus Epulonipiscium sp.]
MSYLRAEDVLPIEVLTLVQKYVSGESIYIPAKGKKKWGDSTNTREILECRNQDIIRKYQNGMSIKDLSKEYFLTEKSIQRIIRNQKCFDTPESRVSDEIL